MNRWEGGIEKSYGVVIHETAFNVSFPFRDESLFFFVSSFVMFSPAPFYLYIYSVIQYCRATSCKKGGTDCISVR